jgi:hypothetical protein
VTRVPFAPGGIAGLGVIVLSLFFVLGLFGVVGVAVLLVTGELHADAGELAMFGVLVVGVALWGASIVRDLRRVRAVEIAGDGTWTLRGPFGFRRGRIAPGVARSVRERSAKVWIFGAPRRYEQTWAEIEAGGRTWKTCASIPEVTAPAIDQLRARQRDRR